MKTIAIDYDDTLFDTDHYGQNETFANHGTQKLLRFLEDNHINWYILTMREAKYNEEIRAAFKLNNLPQPGQIINIPGFDARSKLEYKWDILLDDNTELYDTWEKLYNEAKTHKQIILINNPKRSQIAPYHASNPGEALPLIQKLLE